ncbi:hypothetical protein SUGI_0994110 [Cryptomeria japonica]|nr:hypothetical protein SUGI_0994110 [Cryptomeria japonica]
MSMSATRSEEHLDLSATENNDVIWSRDVGISMRENGNGYPIKRFHSNGLDLHQEAQKVSGVVKGGGLHGSGRKSGSSWLCSVLICIVIMCFLTQSLLQDTLTTFMGPIESSRPGYSHEVEVDFSQSLENANNVNLHGEPHVHPIKHPRLAIVCSDLSRSPGLLFLFTVETSLQALGYDLELFSLEDGPMHAVWENLRTSVNILQGGSEQELKVDWLRTIFTDAFKNMYNLPETWTGLPPMPLDGDSWSVLHSWAMPNSSFMELVMFASCFGSHYIIFVDSIDAQHYEEHRKNGRCCLSVSKMENQHCYCRLLELLVNVWAYHSARKMVYVNPETGLMQEQHRLENRKGQMWVKWFNISRLKAMDEDLAEVADYEQPEKRWLWPHTAEIFWQGIYERERQQQLDPLLGSLQATAHLPNQVAKILKPLLQFFCPGNLLSVAFQRD